MMDNEEIWMLCYGLPRSRSAPRNLGRNEETRREKEFHTVRWIVSLAVCSSELIIVAFVVIGDDDDDDDVMDDFLIPFISHHISDVDSNVSNAPRHTLQLLLSCSTLGQALDHQHSCF